MPKFIQPGIIIYEGKEYHCSTNGEDGDNVPMSKAVAEHHRQWGGVIWWPEPVSPKQELAAMAAAGGMHPDGSPLPVHPETGVPAPLDTFPKTVPAAARTDVTVAAASKPA